MRRCEERVWRLLAMVEAWRARSQCVVVMRGPRGILGIVLATEVDSCELRAVSLP